MTVTRVLDKIAFTQSLPRKWPMTDVARVHVVQAGSRRISGVNDLIVRSRSASVIRGGT